MGLNENQKKVVEFMNGPLLVVAGPGSGKTTVVINRVANLVKNNVKPENILVITFTKQAAKEMEERYISLTGESFSRVNFGTIHSVSLRILVESFGYSIENVLTEKEKWSVLQKIIQERKIPTDDIKNLVKNLVNAISLIKTGNLTPPYDIQCGCRQSHLEQIYKDYISICDRYNKIDYDDMQIKAYEGLLREPGILKQWQQRFKYISVDEAQDMDQIQSNFVYLLAKEHRNICIVGDDDQSLYRFRGAKPEIMLNFEKKFNATKVLLDTNYRSGCNIVDTTSQFIKSNKIRFDKDFKHVRSGGHINVVSVKDEGVQTDKLTASVKTLLKRGVKPEEIAVIYRTNKECTKPIDKFMKQKIPFTVKAADMVNVFEHWIFKDICNFYQLSRMYSVMKLNEFPPEMLARALKRPSRYVPGECFKTCSTLNQMKDWAYDHKKMYLVNNLNNFITDLKAMSKLKFKDFLNYLDFNLNYYDALVNYADYTHQSKDELIDIYMEIIASANDYDDYEEWFEHSKDFTITLKDNINSDGVKFLTMHSSKGLEFDHVFIINANEGTTPFAHNGEFNDIEEERRMFYVALTRAKDNITIFSTIKNNSGKKTIQSRFVDELKLLPHVSFF